MTQLSDTFHSHKVTRQLKYLQSVWTSPKEINHAEKCQLVKIIIWEINHSHILSQKCVSKKVYYIKLQV